MRGILKTDNIMNVDKINPLKKMELYSGFIGH